MSSTYTHEQSNLSFYQTPQNSDTRTAYSYARTDSFHLFPPWFSCTVVTLPPHPHFMPHPYKYLRTKVKLYSWHPYFYQTTHPYHHLLSYKHFWHFKSSNSSWRKLCKPGICVSVCMLPVQFLCNQNMKLIIMFWIISWKIVQWVWIYSIPLCSEFHIPCMYRKSSEIFIQVCQCRRFIIFASLFCRFHLCWHVIWSGKGGVMNIKWLFSAHSAARAQTTPDQVQQT